MVEGEKANANRLSVKAGNIARGKTAPWNSQGMYQSWCTLEACLLVILFYRFIVFL